MPESAETVKQNAPLELLEFSRTGSSWRLVTYKCSNERCKAIDHDSVHDGERIAPAINCWKCGNGKGVELQQMLAEHRGMFPVSEPTPYN